MVNNLSADIGKHVRGGHPVANRDDAKDRLVIVGYDQLRAGFLDTAEVFEHPRFERALRDCFHGSIMTTVMTIVKPRKCRLFCRQK